MTIENKIDKINSKVTKMGTLQEDRLKKLDLLSDDIIDFLRLRMKKVDEAGSLKSLAIEELKNRVELRGEDEISVGALIEIIKVFGILEKDVTTGTFEIVKGQQVQAEPIPLEGNEDKGEISKQDVQDIKDLLKTMKKIENTEFS